MSKKIVYQVTTGSGQAQSAADFALALYSPIATAKVQPLHITKEQLEQKMADADSVDDVDTWVDAFMDWLDSLR